MNKDQFMNKLEVQLRKLPEDVRKELLYDYEEHFDTGIMKGHSEEELANQLGDPRRIGKDLLAQYRLERAQSEKSVKHILQAIFATMSVSFLNLILVLGPAIGVIGLYIGLCSMAIGLAITPFLFIGSMFLGTVEPFFVNLFISITLGSGGLLMSSGLFIVGKWLYKLTLSYIRFNIRIVKGENAA
ncbi:HAAS signaling domain-containing protein [Pontibacillus salipaludis]|uniref:DUF1700 domain-containing protein n=1 Tax=Pontibacillus salipaludis TaxID=1697394 RepID=A0ABQ1QBB3_9BACI|nr:DUF1700 domain-containing protein [Pontibacillus salipaludis]GGD21906.1 hypothetical protein GCM10011389_31970 [Pontibacillus salipaludis]